MSVVAPYVLQGGRIEPYVSVPEVQFSATAAALDLTNLVPDGNAQAQEDSLYELIVRASSKIDTYTMGKYGTLNATSNTENGRYRINRQGQFAVHPSFSPILEVTNFTWGTIMGQAFSVPLSASNCWIERDHIIVQVGGSAGGLAYSGINALSYIANPGDGLAFCTWTYVNGWANTFLSAPVSALGTSVPVTDPTGIYPLMNLTIWDGSSDEYVQVAGTYDGVSSTIPLANPLAHNHASGANISALHASVKQACIHFVCHLVTERGQGGITLGSEGQVETGGDGAKGLSSAHEIAGYDLLDEFRSVWGRM